MLYSRFLLIPRLSIIRSFDIRVENEMKECLLSVLHRNF